MLNHISAIQLHGKSNRYENVLHKHSESSHGVASENAGVTFTCPAVSSRPQQNTHADKPSHSENHTHTNTYCRAHIQLLNQMETHGVTYIHSYSM